jgi:hypothetical protein
MPDMMFLAEMGMTANLANPANLFDGWVGGRAALFFPARIKGLRGFRGWDFFLG